MAVGGQLAFLLDMFVFVLFKEKAMGSNHEGLVEFYDVYRQMGLGILFTSHLIFHIRF